MNTFLQNLMNDTKYIELKKQLNKTKHWGVMLLVGILLMVIAMPTNDLSMAVVEDGEISISNEVIADEDYKSRMESELKYLLQTVEGVGNVEVMITLSTSSKKVVEKDMINKDLDIEEETIYQDNSEGQSPYVNQEIYPEISGVIVAAGGGDNPVVIKNITEAIQALFHVDTHKIKIMKMKYDS